MQQFLYTFRYFCTPHDFLLFLLDRISSSLARYSSLRPPVPRLLAVKRGCPREEEEAREQAVAGGDESVPARRGC